MYYTKFIIYYVMYLMYFLSYELNQPFDCFIEIFLSMF